MIGHRRWLGHVSRPRGYVGFGRLAPGPWAELRLQPGGLAYWPLGITEPQRFVCLCGAVFHAWAALVLHDCAEAA